MRFKHPDVVQTPKCCLNTQMLFRHPNEVNTPKWCSHTQMVIRQEPTDEEVQMKHSRSLSLEREER